MKPSDKVVCINDGPCKCCGLAAPLRKGLIYTVIESFPSTHYPGKTGLVLVGVSTGIHKGLDSTRFRLLAEVQLIASAISKHKTYEPTLIP